MVCWAPATQRSPRPMDPGGTTSIFKQPRPLQLSFFSPTPLPLPSSSPPQSLYHGSTVGFLSASGSRKRAEFVSKTLHTLILQFPQPPRYLPQADRDLPFCSPRARSLPLLLPSAAPYLDRFLIQDLEVRKRTSYAYLPYESLDLSPSNRDSSLKEYRFYLKIKLGVFSIS